MKRAVLSLNKGKMVAVLKQTKGGHWYNKLAVSRDST